MYDQDNRNNTQIRCPVDFHNISAIFMEKSNYRSYSVQEKTGLYFNGK